MLTVKDITLSDIQNAHAKLNKYPDLIYKTPLIQDAQYQLKDKIPSVKSLALKLESMQCTGSFKIRGVLYQFLNLSEDDRKNKRTLVTMSAGNYGKAFSYVAKQQSMPGIVFMPDTAPNDRQGIVESHGCQVRRVSTNLIRSKVDEEVERTNGLFFHSYDDPILFLGHGSAGLELIEQCPTPPDIVLICCGGGGFLASVATTLKLGGWQDTRVYGVEPENVQTMYQALNAGKAVPYERRTTIAAGLAPPTAGQNAIELVKRYSDGVLLISEDDIKKAMRALYSIGLVVEPSGAAAFAALLSNKVPDVEGKDVVVMITGGNVTTKDLNKHINGV